MLRGILYEDPKPSNHVPKRNFSALLQNGRSQAKQVLGNRIWREKPLFEAAIHPQRRLKTFTLSDCRRHLESLEKPGLHDFPWPSAQLRENPIYASNEAIRCHSAEDTEPAFFWEFYPEGLFYCAVALPELPGKSIDSATLLQLCVITLALNGELFSQMGLGGELLTLIFRLNNTLDMNLNLGSSVGDKQNRCHIHDIHIFISRTAGDIEGGAAANTSAHFFREFCERFNYRSTMADFPPFPKLWRISCSAAA